MIALYARVSTAEQANEGYSIDEQIERLKKYSEAHGRTDYAVYVDAGRTGTNIQRPALQEIISDAKAGKLDKVLVYKLDRLSRSQKDTLYLIEDIFLANGVDFESMSEKFDTATSFGKAMIGILAVFAQLEREQIRERMSMGKAGRAKQGKWHGGGHIPIGYEYEGGSLVVNEFEAMQVKEIFQRFASGESIGSLERDLNTRGLSHKYGIWARDRIARTLQNNVYIGVIKNKGEEYEGDHTPLVDLETYEAVQKRMKERKGKRERVAQHVLGGLLYCKRCGAKYSASTYRVVAGTAYRYYACYSRHKVNIRMIKDPDCKNTTWRTDMLDELVFAQIRQLSLDTDKIHEMRRQSQEMSPERSQTAEILKRELEKLESQKNRLIDLYSVGGISKEEISERVIASNKRVEALTEQLQAIQDKSPEISEDEAVAVLESFSDIMEKGSFDQVRLMVETLIDKIEIDGEDIYIHWRFC